MRNISEIEIDEDMGIVLPDGCRLSARVWKPKDALDVPVPVILEYLPYRKRDGTIARDSLTHPYFAKRGYACVRVDMRGNGDSDGVMNDEYTEQELSDAEDVIAWLVRQPWCSGSVAMMGISWGGFNALQVAARGPEPLKAIITLCSTVDRYADDIHYKGGCLLNENMGWGSTMWAYSSRPPDPDLVGDRWKDMWLERLEAEEYLPIPWLQHQNRDDYWKHGSVCEDYASIKAATLAIGGWGDGYKNTVSHLVENLTAPVKGIVGPWVHKYPHFAVPEPRIGFLQIALDWFDRWLKDIDNGVDDLPAYVPYVMDGVRPQTWYSERSGEWLGFDAWPCEQEAAVYHFGDTGALCKDAQSCDVIVSSPQTCGMDAGEYCAIWLGPEMPGDQRNDDAVSGCFVSDALETSLDVVGAPKIKLLLKSSTPQAQIAVRLTHIHPDGARTRVTYGVLNLTHRNGHEQVVPLDVDQTYEFELSLDQCAYSVPKGHKIGVSISNAYWPLLWPMPDAGDIRILSGSVSIPLVDRSAQKKHHFPEPEADTAWEAAVLRSGDNQRRVTQDMKTGRVTLDIVDDFGRIEDQAHGLIIDSVARESWSIHPDDPLSARGETHWSEIRERGEWKTRTETYAVMTSDRDFFHISAKLHAFEGDTLIFEKEINEQIPRIGH